MKSKLLLVLVAAIVTGACGCGGSSASSPPTNSTLAITTISPTSAPAGGAAFILAVQGTNFVPGSVINFGSMPITAAYSCLQINPQPSCSATQLSATIPAGVITTPGAVPVTVTNPAGGGTSNAVNFTITSGPYPEANITSIGPTGALAGSPGFTLELIVVNFLAGSVVRWNGSDRPTTASLNFADSWNVEAQIPASDLAAPGTTAITVFNPAPGAGSSNAVTFAIAAHGLNPSSVAVDPAGKFAYVTNSGTDNVLAYAINTSGTLTFIGTIAAGSYPMSTVAGIPFPNSIAVDPSGKFAYVTNPGTSNVLAYAVNANGTLTFKGSTAAGTAPVSVAVDPSGKFAYVANQGSFQGYDGSVSMYTIDTTTGGLTPNGTIAPGTVPVSVAVGPSGKFAYVANQADGSVSIYTIDTTTGALTPNGEIGGLATFGGMYGEGNTVVFDPSGRFAYVGQNELVNNTLSGGVSMYSIDATTGKLTSTGTVDAAGDVLSLSVHPSGNFAYAATTANSFLSPGHVSVYTLNAATGVLASNGTAPTELYPISIAIDPSGKFAYVANYISHSISMYMIDAATGTLTLIGTMGT